MGPARSRTVLLAGLAVVLLAVVAFASSGFRLGGEAPRLGAHSLPSIPNGVGEYLVLLGMVGVGTTVVLYAYEFLAAALQRRRREEDPRLVPRPRRPSVWAVAIVALAMAAVMSIVIVLLLLFRGQGQVPVIGAGRPRGTLSPVTPPPPWRGWTWGPAILVAITVAALASFLAFATRRERRPEPPKRRERDRMVEVVRRSIDDIRREPDPRRAVISAYARMEEELADGGWPRPPSSAPFEYLEQALDRLAVPPAPTRSLTELFEIARFSRRPIDDRMKERAVDALIDVQDALRQPAT